jgi:hypothetical protein
VYERGLDVFHRNVTIWLRYAEMEMRHRFINHARNVWDRAVTLLPRVDQLWWVSGAADPYADADAVLMLALRWLHHRHQLNFH